MPVSNISVVGVRSSARGASWWIPRRLVSAGRSSPRSIVSPSRLKIRPSVASPTGTVIGPPVSITSAPRASPSVVSIATARTRSSPRCCWTSHTSTLSPPPGLTPSASSSAAAAGRATVIAWLISGSFPEKTASITTPWISSMRPTFRSVAAPFAEVGSVTVLAGISSRISCLSVEASISIQTLGARDYLHDLLRDLGQPRTALFERQIGDDLPRVLRGAAHRGHLRAEEARGRLDQSAVDRDLDVVRHQALEDLLRAGLVLDEGTGRFRAVGLGGRSCGILPLAFGQRRPRQRQQRLACHLLGERRDVGVVDDVHAVALAVHIGRDQIVGDPARIGVGGTVGKAAVATTQLAPSEGQRRHAASPGRVPNRPRPLFLEFGGDLDPGTDDLRVEPPREPAIAGDEQQRAGPGLLAPAPQIQPRGLGARGETAR